ncbi:unnamed protein product [Orchesella dallaii]|uniref:Secreted protein n=1 Tax=Orchesella dallaii TaxID=48710 RepID=A0ABP1RWU0_9HEXA
MNKIILTFLIGTLCHLSLATNEAGGNKTITEADLAPKIMERIASYTSAIKYWDTNNEETRRAILKDLAAPNEEFKTPGCPKIRFPIICDDTATILENVCEFRMRRREKPLVLPVMVFTITEIEDARSMCNKQVNNA